MIDVPGFSDPKLSIENKKYAPDNVKKKGSKKTGGFQAMNLNFNILKGITKRGYKQPTPIQRKVLLWLIQILIYY